jgi:hypothetical protein
MSNPLNLPFLPGYVAPGKDDNLISQVTGALEGAVSAGTQAVTDAASTVAGDVGGPVASSIIQDAGAAVQAGEQAVESVIPTAVPTAATPGQAPTSVTGSVTDITTAIESAAKTAATGAISAAAGTIEMAAERAVDKALGKLISSPPNPPALSDFIHADARSRAFRTLMIGLGLSVLWGIVSALGAATNLNWFDKTAWPALFAIMATSVTTSVVSYVTRLVKEPPHTATISSLLSNVPAGGK